MYLPSKFFRFMVKRILNKAPFILVRGKENLKEIQLLKLKTPVYNCPDSSFLLEPETKEWAEEYLTKLGLETDKEIIGISPSYVINNLNNNHIDLCKKIITYFQSQGKQVLIIPHSINNNAEMSSCDLTLSQYIYEDLENKESVFLVTDTHLEYKHIRSIMGFLSFYITGRYHGLISSLYMGVPTIVFSWHIKYQDLLSFFLDKFPMIKSNTTNEEAFELIKENYKNQEWFNKKEVEQKLAEVKKKVEEGLALIKSKC